jgi:hypothetical protein
MNVLKCDFGDVYEAIFHNVVRPFERILHSVLSKQPFGGSRLSDVLSRRMALGTINLPAGHIKKRLC